MNHEIISSIINLLRSDISNSKLTELTGISPSTISDLRRGDRDLQSMQFQNAISLYMIAVEMGLDQSAQDEIHRKKNYTGISRTIPCDQIYVASSPEFLFQLGLLVEQPYQSKTSIFRPVDKNMPERIHLTNVALYRNNYDPIPSDILHRLQFQVGYGGSGPHAFLSFLQDYSFIEETKLKEVIFNNEIVGFDFKKDEIFAIEPLFCDGYLSFYNFNQQLAIRISSSTPEIRKHRLSPPKYRVKELHEYLEMIQMVMSIAKDKYFFDTRLKEIIFINDYTHITTEMFKSDLGDFFDRNSWIIAQTILKFDEFQIWIPSSIYGIYNPFENSEFVELMNNLGWSHFVKQGVKNIKRIPFKKREPYFKISLSDIL